VRKFDELEALLAFTESKCGGESPDIYVPSAGISEMVYTSFRELIILFVVSKIANCVYASYFAWW